ncbi:hypothetical protein [Pontibacter sp. G13]|uniref:hypothetical protein n=1 Tax=Pontibacter sp. G13 TaxID=3074898 RepID=UPI00288B9A90|nr:hypothetical protein [Pontibacter sp. G13]WNJ21575.1 hypothetical protein RJD25_28985 [Pontibacter sp. G13]
MTFTIARMGIMALIWGLLSLSALSGQTLRPGTLPYYESSFEQWRSGRSLDSLKGWKWYKRWENRMQISAQPDGSIPTSQTYFQGLSEAQSIKLAARSASSSGWTPVGPDLLATPSPSMGLITGIGRINCIAFHPSDSAIFWVGVAQGGVWKTSDHGQSWTPLTDELPMLRISDIAVNPQNADELYISVGDYAYLGVALETDGRKRHTYYGLGVYKTTNGGISWQPTGLSLAATQLDESLIRRVIIHPNQPQQLVAAGIQGIWTSSDGGNMWNQTLDSMIWDIEQDPSAPNTLYASTAHVLNLGAGSAGVWKSVDFGQTWQVLPTGIPAKAVQRVELSISAADPQYIYAVCCDSQRGFYGCYRSTNGGANWTLQSTASSSYNILNWYLYAQGQGGQGTYDLAVLADPHDPDRITVGGINLWVSTNGGASWEAASYWTRAYGESVHADQHMLSYNPLDEKTYLCNDGGVVRTDSIESHSEVAILTPGFEWTTQWEQISQGMAVTSFYRLGVGPAGTDLLMAGAQDNSTFLYNGQKWTNVIGGDGMECIVDPTLPQHLFGSYQYGTLFESFDGGNSFSYISSPPNAAGDAGGWTTPMMLHPVQSSQLWAAFGDLWEYQSGGWTAHSTFADVPELGHPAVASALAISPISPHRIYIAKRPYHAWGVPSSVHRTDDGGSTWAQISDSLPTGLYVTYLATSQSEADGIWASFGGQVAGEKVYFSADGGNTWENRSFNLPNLPVNCLATQGTANGDIMYAGTDAGIFYLPTGSQSWLPFSDGLPNVIVSELEIDTAQGKLLAATFGRGIWQSDLIQPIVSSISPTAHNIRISVSPSPVPADAPIRVKLENSPINELDISLINIQGRLIFRRRLMATDSVIELNIPHHMAPGIYYLVVHSGQSSKSLPLRVE